MDARGRRPLGEAVDVGQTGGGGGIERLLPLVFSADRHWAALVDHALPTGAWIRLVDVDQQQVAYPWTLTGAWTVYAVWALATAAVAVTSVQRRDQ
ncbi:hypothetical protein O3Q52_42535 [Streptomyces sp. ActVer]|uniref:hypothetical protein n=1 Tax=Streptomyces sp. ActVer TaxID=3014558 RepID=UPI0022B464A3|nr:hypothetical protein [Streptomyces sp. ActVer]MCZ4514692.1 hypothetical protein [Streptomyces sp. ActVer]